MGFLSGIVKMGQMAASSAINIVERIGNGKEFDGVMAGVVLIATADGKITAEEEAAACSLLKSLDAFKPFDSRDIDRKFKEGAGLIGADTVYGTEALLDKIRALDAEARGRITGICLKIAAADGNVDDAERAMIDRIRSA